MVDDKSKLQELEACLSDMPVDAIRELIIAGREAMSRGGASPDTKDYCDRTERWLGDWEIIDVLTCKHDFIIKRLGGTSDYPPEYVDVCQTCGYVRNGD